MDVMQACFNANEIRDWIYNHNFSLHLGGGWTYDILANMFNFVLYREYLTVYIENKYACTLMLVTKEI